MQLRIHLQIVNFEKRILFSRFLPHHDDEPIPHLPRFQKPPAYREIRPIVQQNVIPQTSSRFYLVVKFLSQIFR